MSSYKCVICSANETKERVANGYFKQNYEDNRTERLLTIKRYAQNNPDKVLIASKQWNQRNKGRMDQYRSEFYSDPEKKKHHLQQCKKYRDANAEQYLYYMNMRRARKLNATPVWLNESQLIEIKQLYQQAKELTEQTGVKHVVDHHYPLQGKTVSGLHCPENLKVIPESENAKKFNKHPADFYNVDNKFMLR